jgi:Family of unknown function (DUF6527)
MARSTKIDHAFVGTMPSELHPDCLYISIEYKVSIHLCLCGCGSRVVAPLSPVAWSITFDGRTVSLAPSIGNWNLRCRSHYWIENNNVIWLGQWSKARIEQGRARETLARERYYGKIHDSDNDGCHDQAEEGDEGNS